jgi:hypothetical protein
MAIVELLRGGASGRPFRAPTAPAGLLTRANRAPAALIGGLLFVLLYTAFANGGVGSTNEVRIQVGISILAAAAAAAWLWSSELRAAAPPIALAGLGLLLAFAAWSGMSLAWSVAPNGTWIEFNRDLTYVIVLGLAIMAGASHPGAIDLCAKGFLAVALVVTAYGLGQKVAPGIHLGSLIDLNQTGLAPRLQAPLGYWNALALFITFAVPIALVLVVDRARSSRARLGALVAVQLMLIVIGLTYSRGGVAALVLALAASVGLGGARLRSLMWLALAACAAAPALALGLTSSSLTATGASLGTRESGAGALVALLIVSVVALVLVGRVVLGYEEQTRLGPERARGVGRLLAAFAAFVVVIGLIGVAASSRGLTGTVSHAWHSFTTARSSNPQDPNHLVSASSGNRWVWWHEAAGAFSARPVAGWGAGSFPTVHLLYRQDSLSVSQPHNVPLQFLAETGLIGTILGIGAYGLLFAAGVGTARRRPAGSERMLAAALVAGGVAYATHALYDWDWDFPGVTLPALVFLGVLAGARGVAAPATRLHGPGLGLRALALAASTLLLCMFALSAVMPDLAGSKASAALVAAASPSQARLQSALSTAQLATRLDPVSDEGLKAAATIATHLGRFASARSYLFDAIRRDPNDPGAWEQLADLELQLGNRRGLIRAANRSLALDPHSKLAFGLALNALALSAPTTDPATVTSTPLPTG